MASAVFVVPRHPILWLRPISDTSFHAPRLPSASTRYLGTMKSDIPLTPGGEPFILASIMWTMFSEMSARSVVACTADNTILKVINGLCIP